jgi:hypothetical protein
MSEKLVNYLALAISTSKISLIVTMGLHDKPHLAMLCLSSQYWITLTSFITTPCSMFLW